jgi:hypothetical protein
VFLRALIRVSVVVSNPVSSADNLSIAMRLGRGRREGRWVDFGIYAKFRRGEF